MSYRQQGYRPTASLKKTPPKRRGTGTQPTRGTRVPPQRKRVYKKRRPQNRFRKFLLSVLAAVLLIAGVVFVYAVNMVKRHDTTFYNGVYVDGVPLYGATVEKAFEYIRDRAKNQFADWSITVQFEDHVWSITPDLFEMQLDVADQINKAWQQGHSGNLIEDYMTIMALRASPYYGYTTILYNEYNLDALMTEIKNTLDVPPMDATVTTDPYKTPPVRYTQEATGRSVDIVSLKQQIIDKLDRLEKATITVQPQVLQPAIIMDMLQQHYTKIADYRTKISSMSTAERNRNIEIGCEKFNGLVVKNGDKVYFNDVTGKRTKDNGYQSALEIVNGVYVDGYGGGICQASSTLYNAAVQAGLEILERHQHGLKVNYLGYGYDATVADRGKDLVFRNNTGQDIIISARMEKQSGNLYCVFQIYGRPDPNGYTYGVDAQLAEEIPMPYPTPTPIPDTAMQYVTYANQTREVEEGTLGKTFDVYKVTYDKDRKEVAREYLYTDKYKPIPPEIYVGVVPVQ